MASLVNTKFDSREFFLTISTLSNVKEEVHRQIKADILKFPALAKNAGHSKDFHPVLCLKESLPQLNLPNVAEEVAIPLHDNLYKGSFILLKTRELLTEIMDRAQRAPSTTHVSIPPKTLKRERCAICLEDLDDEITAELDTWKALHAPVVTSCGHVFGGVCLQKVNNKSLCPLS